VATAIPKISDHFKALNDIGWYASAFFLTTYGDFIRFVPDCQYCITTDIWEVV
jgi:hypothetical protein